MVVFRNVKEYQCSTCGRWFKEREKTLFLKIFSHHSHTFETVAVFCSETCKGDFTSTIFPISNNHPVKVVSC